MSDRCQSTRNRMTLIGAVHLFLTRRNDILLSRRANTGYYDGWWSVPAGHIEPGEPATTAMIREAHEEIGITILDPDVLTLGHIMHRRSVDTDCTNSERVDFFYTLPCWLYNGNDFGEPVNREPRKCDRLGWFPINALPQDTVPYVRDAITFSYHGRVYSESGWGPPCPRCGSTGTSTSAVVA